jgi:uncharacterized protein YegJ (DUF2314 family)
MALVYHGISWLHISTVYREGDLPQFAKLCALALSLAIAVLPLGSAFSEESFSPRDAVILFDADDPAMNAAIERARNSLLVFWKMFGTPGPGISDFSLKLGISDGKMVEHFWCSDIQGNAGKATCAIANEPQNVFTVSNGQRIDVDPAIISDWMYRKDGKIVGGQTIRVMVTRMEPEEAAQTKAMLADE